MLLAGVPVLIAMPQSGIRDSRRPAVIWMHGFRADALGHAAELERCASMGFVAVGVDAVDHGARSGPQLEERLRRSEHGAFPVMLDVVAQTVRELPALIDALVREYAVDRQRISLVGISMGAFLTYQAIADGLPLRAAVALLGSPEWPGDTSAHLHMSRVARVALLSITAEHDASVPPGQARRLHCALDHHHAAVHGHHELVGSGHLTSAAHWAEAMQHTIDWLLLHGV